MAALNWQTAIIKKVENETANTRRFYFEVKDAELFHFEPGQFVSFDLPIHEKASKRLRSYSIASWPNGSAHFELCIVLLEQGAGTTYLFNEGKPGLEIPFRGPAGHFTIDDLSREICMICTGTGIAPFRSQINHLQLMGAKIPETHLIFGTRYKSDLLYYDELRKLEAENEKFHYYPTLSRDTSEDWSGKKGYVHPVYEELCDHGKKEMEFYLCGWRVMIDEARHRLSSMGYTKDHIHLELYG